MEKVTKCDHSNIFKRCLERTSNLKFCTPAKLHWGYQILAEHFGFDSSGNFLASSPKRNPMYTQTKISPNCVVEAENWLVLKKLQ